jgi:hypothetical protein
LRGGRSHDAAGCAGDEHFSCCVDYKYLVAAYRVNQWKLVNEEIAEHEEEEPYADANGDGDSLIPPGADLAGADASKHSYDSAAKCMKKYDGAKVAAKAKALVDVYNTKPVTVYDQAKRSFGGHPTYADCSSFVESVLENSDYGCLFGRQKARTQLMRDVIAVRGGGYHTGKPKVGDVMMWASGASGHVAIVVKDCGGGKIQMAHMGSHGARVSACYTINALKLWGNGGVKGFKGFWTPH